MLGEVKAPENLLVVDHLPKANGVRRYVGQPIIRKQTSAGR